MIMSLDNLPLHGPRDGNPQVNVNNDNVPISGSEMRNRPEIHNRKVTDLEITGVEGIELSALLNTPPAVESFRSVSSSPLSGSSQMRTFDVSGQRLKVQVRQRQCPSRPPRDPRPMYTQEEADAILYYRDSVQLPWKKVVDSWNNLYDVLTGRRWGPRTISGLQSHYYRMLGFDKCNGRRPSAPNPEIGLLKTTDRRYWWTYGSHPGVMDQLSRATPDELKTAAKQHARRLRREAHKVSRRQRKPMKRLCDKGIVFQENQLPVTKTGAIACQDTGKTHEDIDRDVKSSLDTYDQQSFSDSDGYVDTLTSISSPPSSRTSVPPSPRESYDHVSHAVPLSKECNIIMLPPFRALDNLADLGNDTKNEGLPILRRDRPQNFTLTRSQSWDKFRIPHLEGYNRPEAIEPFRPAYMNPMAVSSILSLR